MAASRLASLAAMAAVAAASTTTFAYADSPSYRFNLFSQSMNPSQSPQSESQPSNAEPKPEVEDSKGGFDPEALERGAKALIEINSSPLSKHLFELMRKQEQARLTELAAEKAHQEAIQAQLDITDHDAQKQHNAELARMQEDSLIQKEQARRATEEQIQAQQRQTEKERAEIERETIRVKAMAEAEGRAHEAKLTEDHNRRMLIERVNGEKEKWLAAINTTFSHVEGGVRMLLTDRSKLVMTVGGVTALAAGVYTTGEGARVMSGYVNRILGQPPLIRESSMAKFPWSGIITQGTQKISNLGKSSAVENKHKFGSIILHPSLQRRIEHIARATANTKSHQAPFRNLLFYGRPDYNLDSQLSSL